MDAIRNNNELFAELLDEMPQGIVWHRPIWDAPKQTIVDFEYAYSNDEGIRYLNISRNQIPGLLLSSTPTVTENLRKMFFEEMVTVYKTGKRSETKIYNPVLNKYARIIRFKFRGGILTIVQDVSEENRVIRELEKEKTFSNSILDASPNGIFFARAFRGPEGAVSDFRIERINPAFTRQTSLKEEQLLGRHFLSVFPEARQNGVFDLHRRVYETGASESMEVQYGQLWFYLLSVQLDDGVMVTFQDITRLKQVSESIEKHRNLLESIQQHSPAGISVTEVIRDKNGTIVDGRIIIANDKAVELVKLPKEVYLSKTILELDPGLLKSPVYRQALHTLETGEPFHTQYYYGPARRWIEHSAARMDDDHLINILTDITSIKQSQLELECSLEELKRTNENLEEFAYAASHDMKEPIRKVRFYADLLNLRLEGKLNEDEQRAFERIENATRRMTLLVDDLLLFSQVTRQTTLEELVDLNVKVRLVLEDLELLIREKQAVITVGELPVVKGHRRQLQQLFSNLIANALKYSKPGEAPQIDIRSRTLPGRETGLRLLPDEMNRTYHLIAVEDKGIGFEQKDTERIFNVFTRLNEGGENKGTGVGLAIASKVVRNHGGYIKAESAPGVGSIFKVYLPVYEETRHHAPVSNAGE
jgi:signal transduction histidine kinase